MNIRVIPRLDIKGPNLVKGIHLEGLRVMGKPERFARFYYENGADELIYQDAVASLYGRNSLHTIVERTSREIFIPLCVAGGLRSVDDIREVLRAGADKVAVNTAAIQRPELIREASETFGSSTIVSSIEAVRNSDGSYEALVDYGRERTGVDAVEWAQQAVDLGAGEILLSSIDMDGTGKGYDLDLTRRVAGAVSVPVIACCGCGGKEHVLEVIESGMADAVSMASVLHYHLLRARPGEINEEEFQEEGNIEFLKSLQSFNRVTPTDLPAIKRYLAESGVACRAAP